ncbi:site-specific integrase [Prauserella endophytica]|uniref:hypothetical protein n=1 Tax=Prauserella endophytica TaxID=1592324 RepID=UPI00197D9246|nr:hypothetical protein [Prauserella endophytica]
MSIAAYVLILVLGLRKGEVLGLTWEDVTTDAGELVVGRQLQRVQRELLHRETKTEASEDTLPLVDVCIAALQARQKQQESDAHQAGEAWQGDGLVFTTKFGTPFEPPQLQPFLGRSYR